MAKIIFSPIGSKLDNSDQAFIDNQQAMIAIEQKLHHQRQQVAQGWGEKYQERVRAKKKLTAYERINKLADDQSFLSINTFVNHEQHFGEEGQQKICPNAGVITGFARIHQRWVVIIANDNTVASGSWWPKTPEKIIRAQEIALKLKLPVIYLVDCSGLFLPEQARTFPGKTGAGHIFKMNSLLSDQGVPQIAGVCGDCIAGGGYMPIISDRVYMTEEAYMVIAGAALIKGAKSQNLSSHDIGGPHVHIHISNCADERVPDDEALIEKIRSEIAKLPSSAASFYRGQEPVLAPKFLSPEIAGILPVSPKQSYDMRQVMARLLDASLFYEYEPELGQEVICGLGRVNGLVIGFLANAQDLFPHPTLPRQQRAGGILYREGVKKLARFSRMLNDDGIPLCWLQDVAGFDVGIEAEKQGLLGYGSSLIYANSTHTTPMMTVLLRKASGAGYYAMAGMPYDPVLQLSTPITRLAVMEGQTLALGTFSNQQDEQAMKQVVDRIERDMDPYRSACLMDTDEIVSVAEIRLYLEFFAESSYQSIGYRRIKNPRIWSLHDEEHCFRVSKTSQKISPSRTYSELKAGSKTISAPMDGMIYLSPSPQGPPFISIGDDIKPGQTIGLIEVMKCFYPFKYQGSETAKLVAIKISSGMPVSSGTEIFEIL